MDSEAAIQLTPTQQRVVGALIEKELATPDNYPLSMNALLTACNQTTSRDPVMDLDEKTVGNTLENLKAAGITRLVTGKGMRVDKYRHVLHEALDLNRAELALTAVLMLRGPQTLNELKARTDRMHGFADQAEVEAALQRLASRPRPLVELLPRQPGERAARWTHLLGPRAAEPTGVGAVDGATRPASHRSQEDVGPEPPSSTLRMWGGEFDHLGPLPWRWVHERLERAPTYWLVTTGLGHAPHATPVWGVWMDQRLLLTVGSPVHNRNRDANPNVTVHLESGTDVVIVEGAAHVDARPHTVEPFLDRYRRKYDYEIDHHDAFVVVPSKVMAWAGKGEAARDGFDAVGKWTFA
jgi:uncharacterized protein YceH (UPF0502 family)